MNKLVEEIIKPILETNSDIKKVIGVFGGRFQPFGPHHKKVYEWLSSQFDDAYITTSNIKKPPKHPMDFKEKVRHMTKMGIPKSKIIMEKTPFVAKKLLSKFDSKTTAVVYIFGKKDTGRLSGGKYFQDYKKNKNNLKGHEEHGYYLVAPHMSVSAGGLEVSGTAMRQLLGSDKFDDSERRKLFKKMFGYFNDGIYQMMTNKFKKLFESDIQTFPWDNTKPKPKDKKLFDKKKRDLIKGQKEDELDEAFTIPIEIGDTVMMGKFKNKKVIVKSIDINEKGDLVINGKSASKFRMLKKPNIFDEETIKEFLTKINMEKIIKEASETKDIDADSGPAFAYGNFKTFKKRTDRQANRLGWEVLNYVLLGAEKKRWKDYPVYPDGPIPAVSYGPAGDGAGKSPNNQVDLAGGEMWGAYKKHINKVATIVGYKILDLEYGVSDAILKSSGKFEKRSLTKQNEVFTKEWWAENLLLEGGAYGHMAHPFDDKDLTFGDLKKIIELGLGGQLSREDNVTEKLDGQNIMVSWKDGKLIAARNKGHIKNGGKTALTTKGIASKFAGRGDIADAFNFAMKDLEKSIKSLSEKQRTKIFNNGYNFMNLEVMWPKSANVIDYDKAELVFHGALKYDKNAKVIGEVPGSARILAGMIKQVNQHIGKKYSIGKPVFLTVPKHQDFGKMKSKFLGRLQKLQNEFGLKDNDTLALYHQSYWERFIINGVYGKNYKVPPKVLKGLTKRWAFFDKSYAVKDIKKDIKEEHILKWVLDFDKKDHAKWVKDNMKPFEILFFEVGAEILKNVQGFMAANPDKAVQGIRNKLSAAITDVRKGGDLKKLNKLKSQLEKFEAIGGVSAIVPSEGIVFKYQGKTYKFTGAFAPVNQITGLISF